MIEIKTIGVWGFEGSLRGCRMPYESFDKSDSGICEKGWNCTPECYQHYEKSEDECVAYRIGPADMILCKKLIKGGSEHRKFMRMIHVQAEVKAPRYWWAEMDKYKWVEANSSSTMHLITKRYLTVGDFSIDKGLDIDNLFFLRIIDNINAMIDNYNDCKKNSDTVGMNRYLRLIKQELPESYNQLRMIDTNYECLLNIYRQRKNHRLSEWSGGNGFCSWIRTLPYMDEFLEVTND